MLTLEELLEKMGDEEWISLEIRGSFHFVEEGNKSTLIEGIEDLSGNLSKFNVVKISGEDFDGIIIECRSDL